MVNSLLCFGLGYSARALTKLLEKKNWTHIGTSRSKQPGTLFFDGKAPIADVYSKFEHITHILISIPPKRELGDLVLLHHQKYLSKLQNLKWIGYLSTTGVYGDTQGLRANESWVPKPSSFRSQLRLNTEQNWTEIASRLDLPLHIFRLPGIYGLGRSVFDQLHKGTAKRINKKHHKFSRIHVEDIAKCLLSSMNNPIPNSIYNVCDDEPAEPEEVVSFAANLLGITPPPLVDFDDAKLNMSEMALSFWNDNRTIDNALIKKELNFQLQYPTFRHGLTAIYQQGSIAQKRDQNTFTFL